MSFSYNDFLISYLQEKKIPANANLGSKEIVNDINNYIQTFFNNMSILNDDSTAYINDFIMNLVSKISEKLKSFKFADIKQSLKYSKGVTVDIYNTYYKEILANLIEINGIKFDFVDTKINYVDPEWLEFGEFYKKAWESSAEVQDYIASKLEEIQMILKDDVVKAIVEYKYETVDILTLLKEIDTQLNNLKK